MKQTFTGFSGAVALAIGLFLAGTPATLALMGNGGGAGQNHPKTSSSGVGVPHSNLQSSDGTQFLAMTRRNIEVENKFSKMALKQSQNEQIKKFAKQVISENKKNESKLIVAYSSNLQTGTPALAAPIPSQTHQAEKELKKLTGQQFDAMYLEQMNGYVTNDQQNLTAASGLSDIDSLVKQMQKTAEERLQQIGQMAQEGSPKSAEGAQPQPQQ